MLQVMSPPSIWSADIRISSFRALLTRTGHCANIRIVRGDIVDALGIAQLGRKCSQRKAFGEVAHTLAK
ncbi:hypothetical protein AC578_5576 [Pseudocercospora eumusae]|uniref:Uncharacterized protein n=1 Tax=Pseudocercospora eumusae TaxID=321146 RepID=A0A139HTD4_9PEZI|nr:hypothetical protein AC578_5576 [Pseudocercospora eumusae]